MQQRLTSLILFALMLELVGCTSSCDSSSGQFKKTRRKPSTMLTTFPGVATGNLPKEQLDTFTEFVNEEICPCRCPTSFAGCIQGDGKCKSAEILGQWFIDSMGDGIPAERIASFVSREVGFGYGGAPKTRNIDLAGFLARGAKNPRLTIVEYADFDCSHCKALAPILEALEKKYGDAISFVFKYSPRGTAVGKMAAEAAEAAARQGKFWEIHDALFKLDILTEGKIIEAAKGLGLKMDRFNSERKEADVMLKVQHSAQEAQGLGITGTPSLFFVGPKGDTRAYFLPLDASGIEARIAMEFAREESHCN